LPYGYVVQLWFYALRSTQGSTKMSEYEATLRDHERTIDELRRQRDDWQDLANRAITQIEEWRAICEEWQNRYNTLLGGN
jgi:chromosome segregation ATPase